MKIRGLHKYCTTCKRLVSNTKSMCGKKKIYARNCESHDKHKYQSRIKIGGETKTRLYQSDNLSEVIQLHKDFRKNIKLNDTPKRKDKRFPNSISDCMNIYVDWLLDADLPEHEIKSLTKDHILAQKRFLQRFLDSSANRSTHIENIGSEHVGRFHKYLKEKGYARRTYNHHIQGLETFFNFLINYGYKIENPFSKVVKKTTRTDPKIITEEELQKLLDCITPENGYNEKAKRSYYRDWLKAAILLFLYTGGRRDDIWLLRWEDKKENYIKILNHKTNRKAKEEIDYRPLYITKDMAALLLKLGGDGDGYIINPDHENRDYLIDFTSKAFSHFWAVSGNKGTKQLRHLRKTFATRLRVKLGDKAKALRLHTDQVAIDHYLDSLELQKDIGKEYMFDLNI